MNTLFLLSMAHNANDNRCNRRSEISGQLLANSPYGAALTHLLTGVLVNPRSRLSRGGLLFCVALNLFGLALNFFGLSSRVQVFANQQLRQFGNQRIDLVRVYFNRDLGTQGANLTA